MVPCLGSPLASHVTGQSLIADAGQTDAYREAAPDVAAALGTDIRSGLSDRDAEARLGQYGPNELAAEKPVAGMAPVPRPVPGRASSSCCSSRRRSRLACGPTSATRRCPTRRSPSSPSCCSTRPWATCRSRAPRRRSPRCARMSAGRGHGDPRRRAAPRSRRGARPGRHHPHRGRRHDPRRRAGRRIDRAADGRGGADRREPAGLEGHRADRRRGPARRPPQHGLQRHGRDLRPRHGRS